MNIPCLLGWHKYHYEADKTFVGADKIGQYSRAEWVCVRKSCNAKISHKWHYKVREG